MRRIEELQSELEDAWRNDHPVTNDEMIRQLESQLEFCYAIRAQESEGAGKG
jgi:hypothetical protein